MKKDYLKPDVYLVEFDLEDRIMDQILDGSWGIGEDDEEGRE